MSRAEYFVGALFGRRRAERARSVGLTGPRVPARVVEVERSKGGNVYYYYY